MITNVIKYAIATIIICLLSSSMAASQSLTKVKISTVIKSNDRVNTNNITTNEGRPGWFIELSRRSAQECNAELQFEFIPWVRALLLLKQAKLDAVFNSSYMEERENYGVYPQVDGILDEQRASMKYSYYAYVLRNSNDEELREQAALSNRNIVVERAASIIPELEKRGAKIKEHVNYSSMLKMVAHHRADAAIGIDKSFDTLLDNTPALATIIMKVKTPVRLKFGYVMFSKLFYADHPELVECFWDKSAKNRKTGWFKKLYQSYQ
ncbi:type 2 periplasmic-binding domain-containing protein [Cognaticolwellia mytili]|uniref:transporter substrate-binding domain-containing protein n=1 Tax=Cognaticolwellia mytili TaxID=1888913 RepID=UPI000A16E0B9|nr:transporter substrate-binding domain-containing protein [Cognaticolwellia mytili]